MHAPHCWVAYGSHKIGCMHDCKNPTHQRNLRPQMRVEGGQENPNPNLRCRTRQHLAHEHQRPGAGAVGADCLGCHIVRQSTRRHRCSAGCRGRNPRGRSRGCSRSSSGLGTSTSSLRHTCCSNRLGRRRRRGTARLGHDRRDQTRRRRRTPVNHIEERSLPLTTCTALLSNTWSRALLKKQEPSTPAHCRSRLREPRDRAAPASRVPS